MSTPPLSMADRDGKIWFDGPLVDWRDAEIHRLTSAFLDIVNGRNPKHAHWLTKV